MMPFRKKKTTAEQITATTMEEQITATMVNVSNAVHAAADDFDARCGFISSVADVMASFSCQG